MVRRHFDAIAGLDTAIPDRFEEAAPRLRVRLGPRPDHIAMYTWRRVGPGLVETLMLQMHGAARNVPPETVTVGVSIRRSSGRRHGTTPCGTIRSSGS